MKETESTDLWRTWIAELKCFLSQDTGGLLPVELRKVG